MKIGIVIDDTLDTADGVQQYVLLVGGWLAKNGHDVQYLAGHTKRSDISNIHSLSRNIKVAFNKNRLSIPLPVSSRRIKNLLNKESYDVLHVQMPYSPLLAGKIIKYAPDDVAIVGTFHVAPHGKNVTWGTSILGLSQRRNLKRINKVISVSQVARRFALETQNIESQVVPNAIDLKQWLPTNKIEPKIDIVFVGRLVQRKGCIYLLKSLKRLSKLQDISQLKVLIVGDGPQRKYLEEYAKINGLANICKFLGFVSESKKKSILQSSKISVFPSTGGESFGIVLLEAMASGSMVLAGNNPGYNTVLGSVPEAMFIPQNIKGLAKSIKTLLNNDNQLKQIYAKQQKIIKQYDIEIVGSAILKVYKQARKINSNIS